MPKHYFSRASASAFLPLQQFASVKFSNLPLGFGHENLSKRGLAADTLHLIGRVPKKCSESHYEKSCLGFWIPKASSMSVAKNGILTLKMADRLQLVMRTLHAQ